MNLIIRIVLLSILNCFLADLNTNHLHIWQFLLDRDTDCTDSASKIQDYITILDCLDDLRVEDFAHVYVDLEEGCRRDLEDMVEDTLLIVRVPVNYFWFVCWHAISLVVIGQKAKTRKPNQ